MILAALIFQVATATPAGPVDSVYSTPALRAVISAAAQANREAPSKLAAYRANIESELGLIIVDTIGRERTGQIEQIEGKATWSRDSGYDVHVDGYRSQSAGIPFLMAGLMKGWSLPMLYGERLLIGVEGSTYSDIEISKRGSKRDTLISVHPFAVDRDQYYRFSGGDTIAVLQTRTRRISVQRIRVTPNLALGARFAAFDGEIDLDAEQLAIVRMRGRFVVSRPVDAPFLSRMLIRTTGTIGVAYAEFVNAQYDDQYWLPATQRIEFQASTALYSGMRSVFRAVSTFSDLSIDDAPRDSGATPVAAYSRRRVTFAPADSLSAFNTWPIEIGARLSSVAANDFDDMAPRRWRADGPPRITIIPSRPDRLIHYNRIEGLFTGLDVTAEARDFAPGVAAHLFAGWAWSERTVRGGFSLSRTREQSVTAFQADRALTSTADFTQELDDGGSSLGALLASIEEVDYVDRSRVGLTRATSLGPVRRALVTGRIAFIRDEDIAATLLHGPVSTSTLFLPNRHAATGSYGFGSIELLIHPNVTGEFLEPGVGARVYTELAHGQLDWVRSEASLALRRYVGPLTLAARADGAALFSKVPPPQTLFEIGGTQGVLSGYRYKEFAGDRAAIFRGFAAYGFPIFRAPRRVRRFLVPGLSPGLEIGAGGGWTGISSGATQAAILALGDGTAADAVSRATGHVRSSAFATVTFFARFFQVGLARPIDHPAKARWVVGIGQPF